MSTVKGMGGGDHVLQNFVQPNAAKHSHSTTPTYKTSGALLFIHTMLLQKHWLHRDLLLVTSPLTAYFSTPEARIAMGWLENEMELNFGS